MKYQALRLYTDAFKTTPTAALQVEMKEKLNYWVNLKGCNLHHPTQDTLKPCWEKERGETKALHGQ